MKKNILTLSVIFLGLVFLSGCNKKETQNNNQNNNQINQNQSSNKEILKEVEVKNTKPLKGNDEVTETINEVDKIIQNSDSDLDTDSLSDDELQL